MDATRRALLGAAALGAGGLALAQTAAAAEGSDHGKPGEGGYARNAVQLAQLYQLAVHKHVFRGARAQKSESDQRSVPANPL